MLFNRTPLRAAHVALHRESLAARGAALPEKHPIRPANGKGDRSGRLWVTCGTPHDCAPWFFSSFRSHVATNENKESFQCSNGVPHAGVHRGVHRTVSSQMLTRWASQRLHLLQSSPHQVLLAVKTNKRSCSHASDVKLCGSHGAQKHLPHQCSKTFILRASGSVTKVRIRSWSSVSSFNPNDEW